MVFHSCSDSGLPLYSVDSKTDFISWNADEVAESRNLLLSKIVEKSEVIIIPSDIIAPVSATDIIEITASDSFLLIIPRHEAFASPLLFNRKGNLITGRKDLSFDYHVLNAIIDDRTCTIYYLMAGIRWFSHHIPDNKKTELTHLRGIESLTVLNGSKFLYPFRDIRNWIYTGSLFSFSRLGVPGQSENNLINYMCVPYIIKRETKVLVQFPLINDTIYLFEQADNTFKPVFGIFSDSWKINIRSNTEVNPEILEQEEELFYLNNRPITKKIVLYQNGSYLLSVNRSDRVEYIFFDEQTKEAYKKASLTDDLHGGFSIELHSLFRYPRNWGFNGNSDYLVYWFSKKEMEKRLPDRLSDTDNNSEHLQSLRRLMSECDDNDMIVFINKLKM